MERLTVDYGKKFSPFRYAMKDGSDTEIGYFKNYDAFYSHMLMVQKLDEYEDLEEQGLLLRLPCKLGDDLYWISSEDDDGKPIPTVKKEEQGIKNILINEDGIFVNTQDYFPDPCDKLGERYALLSREEAEQKLKEMEESK